jgi:D-sedoheptulose 7-phosphate isomerase
MKEKVLSLIRVHRELLDKFEHQCVDNLISISQCIIDCLKKEGVVYICGNGGSAADAQHIAGELVNRFKKQRTPLPAVSLSTDTSVITAIANDFSFEDVFSKQVEALITSKDILWGFSTSGSSKNVVKAAKLAKSKKAKVIAFTGKKDSELEQTADLCLCIESQYASDSQEIHQLAYHIICGLVEDAFV